MQLGFVGNKLNSSNKFNKYRS